MTENASVVYSFIIVDAIFLACRSEIAALNSVEMEV